MAVIINMYWTGLADHKLKVATDLATAKTDLVAT